MRACGGAGVVTGKMRCKSMGAMVRVVRKMRAKKCGPAEYEAL